MDQKRGAYSHLVEARPGLSILRLAALLAEGGEADDDTLDLMFEQLESGALDGIAPALMWPEIARGLMAPFPAAMVGALRNCGVLEAVLPEVASLFGVPQITDGPDEIDLGDLLLNALNEAARRGAPLEVRFALLTMHVGKADSPREHLPVHYRHMERGAPRIRDIAARFEVGAACRDLALLSLAECERVHRVSEIRAGPVASMLERVGAFSAPERFARLLDVCTCDYFGHGQREGDIHPKVALLQAALAACAGLKADDAETADDPQAARAMAIAQAFRSVRWSNDAV